MKATLQQNDFFARATARALLEGDGPPSIIVSFGRDSQRATVGIGTRMRMVLRDDHESAEQFELRVCDESPAGGVVIMWPIDSSEAA